MKSIHRLCLWVLGLIMPVFIAACYGMPYGFTKTGRVLDRNTRKGISGLQVICVDQGSEYNYDYSSVDGSFMLPYDYPCDEVKVVDVVGAVLQRVRRDGDRGRPRQLGHPDTTIALRP